MRLPRFFIPALILVVSSSVLPAVAQAPRGLTDEEMYFYKLAICGDSPAGQVDFWGKEFDAANYKTAAANEFSRQGYRERTKALLERRLAGLSFETKYNVLFQGSLGEYSFSGRGFPLQLGSILRFNIGGISVYGGQPDNIINMADYAWMVPMAEAQASSYVASHQDGGGRVDRSVLLNITYSVVRTQEKCRPYDVWFRTYFHSVDVLDPKSRVRIATLRPSTTPDSAKLDAPEKLRTLISALPELKGYFYEDSSSSFNPRLTLRVKSFEPSTGAVTAEIDFMGSMAVKKWDPPIPGTEYGHSSRATGSLSGGTLSLTATWTEEDAIFGGNLRKVTMQVDFRYDLLGHKLVGTVAGSKTGEPVTMTFPIR